MSARVRQLQTWLGLPVVQFALVQCHLGTVVIQAQKLRGSTIANRYSTAFAIVDALLSAHGVILNAIEQAVPVKVKRVLI